ncbi:MAG: hypothetical protein PHE32_03365 [Candidatus Shapirobacteria bacterium]|nr:hypothetical protein [Candidatus Shapirobacteria bacterium]MDD4410712.1 hypothetical protein [Candidatus Shapirobacteria bacterium]
MANYPDICVWFEINKNNFSLESKLPNSKDNQDIEKENADEVVTNNQSRPEDKSDDINFLITDDSYFFRVHSSIEYGCYVFSFFNSGWQYLPFRVFLEASPKIKITFINFNDLDLTNNFSLLPSKKNKRTTVKSYSMNLMFPGSLCIIEGVLYYADFLDEGPYTYFTLIPF